MNECAQKMKKRAAELLIGEGWPLDPRQNPILQLIDVEVGPESEQGMPTQVEISHREWEEYREKANLDEVVDEIVNREQMELPEDPEKRRVMLAELAALIIAD